MSWGKQEKYKTFSVSTKGVTNIDKNSNESVVTVSYISYKNKYLITISYKIKFTDTMQYLWQVHYQILFIIKLKMIFFNMKVSKTTWQNINAYLAIKIIQIILMKN